MKADYLFHADAIEGSVDEPLFGVALNDKVGHCGLSYEVVDKNNAKIIHLGFRTILFIGSESKKSLFRMRIPLLKMSEVARLFA